MKMSLDSKWRAKFASLQSSSSASQRQTASDVKQLTVLHATHVAAVERALRDEAGRLGIAREQNKQLTIARAADAAKMAAERERDARDKARSLQELEKMRLQLANVRGEREEAERKLAGARGEAGRMEDGRRIGDARVQGVKARLAEAEAECAALTRELRESRASSRGGSDLADLLRKENALLRKRGEAAEVLVGRMRECLLSVNQQVYGAKAVEMCRRVAEGERGGGGGAGGAGGAGRGSDRPLVNLTNGTLGRGTPGRGGGKSASKKGRGGGERDARKPFVS